MAKRKRGKSLTNSERAAIEEKLRQGKPPRQVAKEADRGLTTVYAIQRQVRARGSGRPDAEPGPHARELLALAARVRDRLLLEPPEEVAATPEAQRWALWATSPLLATPPRDAQEEAVERAWRVWRPSGRYDAQEHPLYPFLRQHLAGEALLGALDTLAQRREEYMRCVREAYRWLLGECGRLGVPESDREAMALSVLWDVHQRRVLRNRPHYLYEAVSLAPDGRGPWRLPLATWCVGEAQAPEELVALREAHVDLLKHAADDARLRRMAEAFLSLDAAIQGFRGCLLPAARLRKLIVEGRCELCT